MTKIYTKSGDDGTTALGGGIRVSKNDIRVEAYGTVDELNAALGVAASFGLANSLEPMIQSIQHMLFDIGADLAFSHHDTGWKPQRIKPEHVQELEVWIDHLQNEVSELRNFILPRGSQSAAMLHLARTVCRRTERLVVNMVQEENMLQEEHAGKHVLQYVNRLSDLLFVMARVQNRNDHVEDVIWKTRF